MFVGFLACGDDGEKIEEEGESMQQSEETSRDRSMNTEYYVIIVIYNAESNAGLNLLCISPETTHSHLSDDCVNVCFVPK